MKVISIILSLILTAYTAQPLLSELTHYQCSTENACCDECSNDCCSAPEAHDDERSGHSDCHDCSCALHVNVVYTLNIEPDIALVEMILEKVEIPYSSYDLLLPPTIWHPPQS